MNRSEFFVKAIKAGRHKERAWVISVFSITRQSPDAHKSAQPFDLIQTPTGCFVVLGSNEDGGVIQEPLEGCKPGRPPLSSRTPINVKAGDFKNIDKDMVTAAGNLFFNACAIEPIFGNRVPYMAGKINIGKFESQMIANFEVSPPEGTPREAGKFYVDERIKFCDAFSYLTEFNLLFTSALTRKAILPPPGIAQKKEELFAKYKDTLSDLTTQARIAKELRDYDNEYIKDDKSAETFLLSAKSRGVVRAKLFLMYGTEGGLAGKPTLIKNSLTEGWEIDKFPSMMNAARAGSFDRGAETMLGGESVKWLLRASSNIRVIVDKDCGSRIGIGLSVDKENFKTLVGLNIITTNSHKLIENEEEAGRYVGYKLMVRSPLYCSLGQTDYCGVCMGERLRKNPDGVSMGITSIGSVFMALFMQSMHGKQLSLAKMDIKKAIT